MPQLSVREYSSHKNNYEERKPNLGYKCRGDISENVSRHGNAISAMNYGRKLLTECWNRKEIQTMGTKLISESISRQYEEGKRKRNRSVDLNLGEALSI